jgi:hypothetical protein
MSPTVQPISNSDRNQWPILLHMLNYRDAGSFSLSIAATVNAAYAKKPIATAPKNPIAPRSSQKIAARAHAAFVRSRTALAVTVNMTLPIPCVAK